MNPHGFGLWDLFAGLCMVLVLGCAAGLFLGLAGIVIDYLVGSRGLLGPRSKREMRRR